MDKDPLRFRVMAEAQAQRNQELHEARMAASPWLASMREAIKRYDQMQEEGQQ